MKRHGGGHATRRSQRRLRRHGLSQRGRLRVITHSCRSAFHRTSLEATLSRVRDLSERVERENRSSQDVTTEFVDVEARLGNLQAAEQQLMVLFERSGKVSDVLEVQRELTNVRGQIESLQGRLELSCRRRPPLHWSACGFTRPSTRPRSPIPAGVRPRRHVMLLADSRGSAGGSLTWSSPSPSSHRSGCRSSS